MLGLIMLYIVHVQCFVCRLPVMFDIHYLLLTAYCMRVVFVVMLKIVTLAFS